MARVWGVQDADEKLSGWTSEDETDVAPTGETAVLESVIRAFDPPGAEGRIQSGGHFNATTGYTAPVGDDYFVPPANAVAVAATAGCGWPVGLEGPRRRGGLPVFGCSGRQRPRLDRLVAVRCPEGGVGGWFVDSRGTDQVLREHGYRHDGHFDRRRVLRGSAGQHRRYADFGDSVGQPGYGSVCRSRLCV